MFSLLLFCCRLVFQKDSFCRFVEWYDSIVMIFFLTSHFRFISYFYGRICVRVDRKTMFFFRILNLLQYLVPVISWVSYITDIKQSNIRILVSYSNGNSTDQIFKWIFLGKNDSLIRDIFCGIQLYYILKRSKASFNESISRASLMHTSKHLGIPYTNTVHVFVFFFSSVYKHSI